MSTPAPPLDHHQAGLLDRLRLWAGRALLGPGVPAVPAVPPDPNPTTRAWDAFLYAYRAGQNLTPTPRTDEGRVAFPTLRTLARQYFGLQACITHLCNEIAALEWQIVPVAGGARGRTTPVQTRRIDALQTWWRIPDRAQGYRWSAWVRALVREDLEIAAPPLYKKHTWGQQGGIGGGNLHSLQVVAGELIKPLLDPQGARTGYQQLWRGAPYYEWLIDPATGACDLLYEPRNNVANSVYGLSVVEQLYLILTTVLRGETLRQAAVTEGNIPAALYTAPEGWKTDQILEWNTLFDALLVGQDWARARMRMVPFDTGTIRELHQPPADLAFDEWVLKATGALTGVKLEELGYTFQVNRATAQVQQEGQARTGTRPIALWLQDLITQVIQEDQGSPDLCFQFQMEQERDDALQVAQVDEIYQRMGTYSNQFIRRERGIQLDADDPALLADQPAPAVPLAPVVPGAAPAPPLGDTEAVPGDELLAKADLRRWREYATRRVADGKPLRPFVSAAIPPALVASLTAQLGAAPDVAAVKAAFAGVLEG